KWWSFCKINEINPLSCTIPNVLVFLTSQYNQGATHGTLNSFRSAIALIYGPNFGENPEIKRFFKEVSKLRPPRPKYDCTWDPGLVLDLLKKWDPNDKLNLEKLSLKVVSLLALVTATSLNLYLKETKPLRKEENRLLISF
ncbi:GSCOCG00002622001-RA-CDS, partial [Cotesia congregata]